MGVRPVGGQSMTYRGPSVAINVADGNLPPLDVRWLDGTLEPESVPAWMEREIRADGTAWLTITVDGDRITLRDKHKLLATATRAKLWEAATELFEFVPKVVPVVPPVVTPPNPPEPQGP